MTMADDSEQTAFLQAMRESLAAETFLKLALSKYHGPGDRKADRFRGG